MTSLLGLRFGSRSCLCLACAAHREEAPALVVAVLGESGGVGPCLRRFFSTQLVELIGFDERLVGQYQNAALVNCKQGAQDTFPQDTMAQDTIAQDGVGLRSPSSSPRSFCTPGKTVRALRPASN